MSMEKAIAAGKERRKPYTGSRAIDASCRCHGGCDWCLSRRMYRHWKRQQAAKERERIYEDETI